MKPFRWAIGEMYKVNGAVDATYTDLSSSVSQRHVSLTDLISAVTDSVERGYGLSFLSFIDTCN